jgi:hypothetical protein
MCRKIALLGVAFALSYGRLYVTAHAAEERIWLDASIDDKKADLVLDTATGYSIVYREAAKRLSLDFTGLSVEERRSCPDIVFARTKPYSLRFKGTSVSVRFFVAELPTNQVARARDKMGDGILGWHDLRQNIVRLDTRTSTLTTPSELPQDVGKWTRIDVTTNALPLIFSIPAEEGKPLNILVDTGCPFGVELAPQRWHEWKMADAQQACTVRAYYTPAAGAVVGEETWARSLSLGSLVLNDVPVLEEAPELSKFDAVLGIVALKRLELVLDAPHGAAYLRPNHVPIDQYEYNHLGALFMPRNGQSDDLVAHVASRSPAEEAGIRANDVLLRIDDIDVTQWRTKPGILPLNRFWTRPAGTKLELAVRRDGKILKIGVVLRQLLPPD